MPEWFLVARAARYWRVAPWEMLRQPTLWTDLAVTLITEEANAEKTRAKRRSRKKK